MAKGNSKKILLPTYNDNLNIIEINDGTITTNYLVDSLGLLIPSDNQITFNPESSRIITIVSITDENELKNNIATFIYSISSCQVKK